MPHTAGLRPDLGWSDGCRYAAIPSLSGEQRTLCGRYKTVANAIANIEGLDLL